MKWNELQEMAADIVKHAPEGDFRDETFSTGSGTLSVDNGIKILHRTSEFAYSTVANGPAYKSSVSIRCRDTQAKDTRGKRIYECEDGTLIVWAYKPGNEYCFDSGRITSPTMTIPT